jgi:quercetin dioxygenase-like cupin family protein
VRAIFVASAVQAAACQQTARKPVRPQLDIPVKQQVSATSPADSSSALAPPNVAVPQGFVELPGELTQPLLAEFKLKQRCQAELCMLTQWLPDPSYALTPLEEVPAQVALWIHELQSGARLGLPEHATLELLVLPLQGSLEIRGLKLVESSAEPRPLPEWFALRAPGVGVELRCSVISPGTCQTLIALVAPESTLHGALANAGRLRSGNLGGARELQVRDFKQAPSYVWNQRRNQARILFGFGAQGASVPPGRSSPTQQTKTEPPETRLPFSLALLQADAASSIPPHTHDHSWESLLLFRASGALELRGRSHALEGGEALHIPPGVRHGYTADGKAGLVALQLYSPAGPERRFVEAAVGSAGSISGPGEPAKTTVRP